MRRRSGMPDDSETWLLDAGGVIIQAIMARGIDSLGARDRLIYCLWVADYGMRNAGDLATAGDVYANFQTEGLRLARDAGLPETCEAFALKAPDLQRQYFERFDLICGELRRALLSP